MKSVDFDHRGRFGLCSDWWLHRQACRLTAARRLTFGGHSSWTVYSWLCRRRQAGAATRGDRRHLADFRRRHALFPP
jgi:hypothetical protein